MIKMLPRKHNSATGLTCDNMTVSSICDPLCTISTLEYSCHTVQVLMTMGSGTFPLGQQWSPTDKFSSLEFSFTSHAIPFGMISSMISLLLALQYCHVHIPPVCTINSFTSNNLKINHKAIYFKREFYIISINGNLVSLPTKRSQL